MKDWMLILALAVTISCGFLIVKRNRQVKEMSAQIAAADEARAAIAQRAAQAEGWNKSLRSKLRERQAKESDGPASVHASMPASAPAPKSAQGTSRLFHDQLMKEALGVEARVGAARSVEKLFDAGLAARLQLSDDQSAALRRLLLQRASIFWDQMMVPMATGDLNASDTGSAGQAAKQAMDDNSTQIRELLGGEGYNTWRWFDQTQNERDEASAFAADAAKSGQGLTPEQQNQLTDLMTGERAGFKFQYDVGDPEKLDFQHWLDNFSEERLSAYRRDMEQLNSRIVQGAQNFLSPDQVTQLNQALARRLLQSMVTIRGTLAMMTDANPPSER
ncbi:MAG TPA: hypothetical protein VHH88_13135 [Verrucomicrobiae bacterium]|nr:hypothetical protein [Verrucomicrobiae bacterium]